jgi:hypothetical protein
MLDKFAQALAKVPSLPARLRSELHNWKLKRVNWGGVSLDRENPQYFLSSGSALLGHTLTEAWKRLVRPARLKGAMFFLDDLQNIVSISKAHLALMLRDQFQPLGVEGMNYSVCFSAKGDYFADTKGLAEPAARFYTKRYLAPFTLEETLEYLRTAFAVSAERSKSLSYWLYEKTLGHPYFLAFICRQLLARARGSPPESPAHLWPEIFRQLEREKFSSGLAQPSEQEIELLLAAGKSHDSELSPAQFVRQSHYEHFSRLMEKGLLIRSGRGGYKLFLQGLKP